MDTKICETCRFNKTIITRMIDGKMHVCIACTRRDCDNWITKHDLSENQQRLLEESMTKHLKEESENA